MTDYYPVVNAGFYGNAMLHGSRVDGHGQRQRGRHAHVEEHLGPARGVTHVTAPIGVRPAGEVPTVVGAGPIGPSPPLPCPVRTRSPDARLHRTAAHRCRPRGRGDLHCWSSPLFFYGPSDPGRAICNRAGQLHRRSGPHRLNETLGLQPSRSPSSTRAFVKGIFTGREITFGGARIDCAAPCFGVSYITREPVTEILRDRFPATLSIAIGGAMIFFPLGVLLGTLAARRRGTITDRMLVGIVAAGQLDPLLHRLPAGLPVPRGPVGRVPRQ